MLNTLFILAGAFIYRMRGGMPPVLPRPFDQALFALPYGLYTGFTYWGWTDRWDVAVWVGLFVLALTTAAIAKGHGNTMDLGTSPDSEPEWYEFFLKWLKPRVSKYAYEATAHSVSGLTYTLPSGIATLNPLLALSGLLKGPAYMLGRKAGAGTMGGELLTGALLWGAF